MRFILSPARTVDPALPDGPALTRPRYPEQTDRLLKLLREEPPWRLERLLNVSPELALRAFAAYQDFGQSPEGAALLSYRGMAYQSLDARSFTADDLAYAQEHVRVFCALFGPLRPLDAIRPYRLELLSRLRVDGESLYRFWGDTYYRDVFEGGGPVVNLASGEYAKAVIPHLTPRDEWVSCRFLVRKRGKLVCLPTASKLCRGAMIRFAVRNRVTHPARLWEFAWDGFAYSPALSTAAEFVFAGGGA